MSGYTKLFGSIIASTIWREKKETKIVWITMLAMANKSGIVEGSVPGLADMARISVEETREALRVLSSPDLDSRSKVDEGRRIREVDGGWFLINHAKYRAIMGKEERREYLNQKQRECRDRRQQLSTTVNTCSDLSTPSTHTEAEAEAEAEAEDSGPTGPEDGLDQEPKLEVPKRTPGKRTRAELNALLEALIEIEGSNREEALRNAGMYAKDRSEIIKMTPDVAPDEIRRRAANYKLQWPNATLTANGLSKHWAKFGGPTSSYQPKLSRYDTRQSRDLIMAKLNQNPWHPGGVAYCPADQDEVSLAEYKRLKDDLLAVGGGK